MFRGLCLIGSGLVALLLLPPDGGHAFLRALAVSALPAGLWLALEAA